MCGYGKLDKINYPKRNEAYFCRVCQNWNDPFSYGVELMKDLIKDNVCKSCARKMNEKRFV
jgi:hypothetical protein